MNSRLTDALTDLVVALTHWVKRNSARQERLGQIVSVDPNGAIVVDQQLKEMSDLQAAVNDSVAFLANRVTGLELKVAQLKCPPEASTDASGEIIGLRHLVDAAVEDQAKIRERLEGQGRALLKLNEGKVDAQMLANLVERLDRMETRIGCVAMPDFSFIPSRDEYAQLSVQVVALNGQVRELQQKFDGLEQQGHDRWRWLRATLGKGR